MKKDLHDGRVAGVVAEMHNAYLEAVGRIEHTTPFYGGAAPTRQVGEPQEQPKIPEDPEKLYEDFFKSQENSKKPTDEIPDDNSHTQSINFERGEYIVTDRTTFYRGPTLTKPYNDGVVMEIGCKDYDDEYPDELLDEEGHEIPVDIIVEAEPGDSTDEDPDSLAVHQLNQEM